MDNNIFLDTCSKSGARHLVAFPKWTSKDINTSPKWQCKFCEEVNDVTITELRPPDFEFD